MPAARMSTAAETGSRSHSARMSSPHPLVLSMEECYAGLALGHVPRPPAILEPRWMNRLMPQRFDHTLPVRTGPQQIAQERNAKREPAVRAMTARR